MPEMNAAPVTILLAGRIDSGNASQVEAEVRNQLAGKGKIPVVLDASDLSYISSAGLRIIIIQAKRCLLFFCINDPLRINQRILISIIS